MSQPSYECEAEFVKLLTRRTDVDLPRIALELARDAYPDLDVQPTLRWIDDRARELSGPVARASTEAEALQALGRCIADRHGIFGDPSAYDSADSSFLHRVVETGRGLPITLSILYIAVAQRLGIDLRGVSTPMHFLTRYESVDGPLYVDAYARGRILNHAGCAKWIKEMAGVGKSELRASMRPVGPRTIVIRMLNNLKAYYAKDENWSAAWVVQHRLTSLQPCSYQERRDLALISLRANRPGHAIDLLKSCLRKCPKDERDSLEMHLLEANTQVCRWN